MMRAGRLVLLVGLIATVGACAAKAQVRTEAELPLLDPPPPPPRVVVMYPEEPEMAPVAPVVEPAVPVRPPARPARPESKPEPNAPVPESKTPMGLEGERAISAKRKSASAGHSFGCT